MRHWIYIFTRLTCPCFQKSICIFFKCQIYTNNVIFKLFLAIRTKNFLKSVDKNTWRKGKSIKRTLLSLESLQIWWKKNQQYKKILNDQLKKSVEVTRTREVTLLIYPWILSSNCSTFPCKEVERIWCLSLDHILQLVRRELTW